jgi:hypothetical protein
MTGYGNENVIGDLLFSNKNVVFGFESKDNDNVRYCYGTVHAKGSADMSFGYFCEKSMEICGIAGGYGQIFCVNNINEGLNLMYCKDCASNTTDSFGCTSLKK